MLYGPSGTGKSLLVRAIANHFGVGLVTVHGAELFSKFYGETETRLREKFDEAIQMYENVTLFSYLYLVSVGICYQIILHLITTFKHSSIDMNNYA